MSDTNKVLNVSGLTVEFATQDGVIRAVDDVSITLERGETLALVGESGSGKSVTSQAIIGTLPTPPGRIASGRITFNGIDVLSLNPRKRRALAGNNISMVSQDAQSALDSRFRVGYQIGEMFRHHRKWSWKRSWAAAAELLDKVHIPNAAVRVSDYPHQFSGGMQQRAVIAAAIALDPDLLIADEPTTALDVTVQAEIMRLLLELKRDLGLSMILVTHDLAQAYEAADKIVVMYAGRIVEQGSREEVFGSPAHPYTRGLFSATPRMEQADTELSVIPGTTPNLAALPKGCAFAPRCAFCVDRCLTERPGSTVVRGSQKSACFRAEEVVAMGSPFTRQESQDQSTARVTHD